MKKWKTKDKNKLHYKRLLDFDTKKLLFIMLNIIDMGDGGDDECEYLQIIQ